MWLLLLTFIVFVVFCVTVFYALVYFGLFHEIVVRVGSPPYRFGAQLVAYKKAKSCYSEASALFTEVCSLTPDLKTFGVYLDEPNEENKDKCRFLVGVILRPQSPEFESQKQLLESKGFICGQLPDVDHVVSTVFPFRSVISAVIAIRRVYPKIKSYIVEHNLCAHPAVEVYDENNIYFMFPLAKQNQFYHLYDDNDEDTTDDNTDEEEEPEEEEKVIEAKENDTGFQMRLRSTKKSSNSSTSSSFEELLAEECPT